MRKAYSVTFISQKYKKDGEQRNRLKQIGSALVPSEWESPLPPRITVVLDALPLPEPGRDGQVWLTLWLQNQAEVKATNPDDAEPSEDGDRRAS